MKLVVDPIIYYHQSAGGISRMYSELLPRLCDLDASLEITLLVERHPPRQALPRHPRIAPRMVPPVSRLLRPRRLWGPLAPRLERAVRRAWTGRGEGEIWHSTYFTMPERWRGAKVVTVLDLIYERLRDHFAQPEDEAFRARMRSCVLDADLVLCISETTRRDVVQLYGVPEERTRVTLLAQSEGFRPMTGDERLPEAPTPRPFLLYVGGRYSYKNFGELLRAYAGWRGARQVDLVAVGGGGWSPAERALLESRGLTGRVHHVAGADDLRLAALYNQASVFVYPSLYEGFGIPLLEAMSCGCPVVASAIPSSLEVAGDCAIYYRPGAEEELRGALDRALAEGRSSERTAAALLRAARFSWRATAEATLDAYRSLGVHSAP